MSTPRRSLASSASSARCASTTPARAHSDAGIGGALTTPHGRFEPRRARRRSRRSGFADILVVGTEVLAEQGVDAPARVVEDLERAGDLALVARLDDLHDGGPELEHRIAQPARGCVGGRADLLP